MKHQRIALAMIPTLLVILGMASPVNAADTADDRDPFIETLQRFVAAARAENADRLAAVFAPDAVIEVPTDGAQLTQDQLVAFFRDWYSKNDVLSFKILQTVSDGQGRCAFENEYVSREVATGAVSTVRELHICTVNNANQFTYLNGYVTTPLVSQQLPVPP